MNVGLWAEIRRLAEIDELSVRAISRRLHCSRQTVTVALKLDHPSARPVARRVRERRADQRARRDQERALPARNQRLWHRVHVVPVSLNARLPS